MRCTVLGLSLIFAGLASALPAYSAEKKPVPIQRPAPPLGLYVHCIDPDQLPDDGYVGSVTVEYGLTNTGSTVDLEVLSSTNECLEPSATQMVGLWIYNPRSIPRQKRNNPLRLSATIKYQFFDENEENKEEYLNGLRDIIIARKKIDHDATPERRKPPVLGDFQKCIMSPVFTIERVVVALDVSAEGKPYNIGILGSTNPCYEEAAANSVEKWEYGPRMIDGQPAPHTDITTTIEFQIGRK